MSQKLLVDMVDGIWEEVYQEGDLLIVMGESTIV